MRRASIFPIVFFITLIGAVSCNSESELPEDIVTTGTDEYVPNKNEVAYEEYVAALDGNESMASGNSLFYSKGEGEFAEVEFFVNEKNEMVKMIEYYTQVGQNTMTVAKKIFYFKDGKKFATKELFEEGQGDDLGFVERVSYYGDDEKPIVTKSRKAPFEQDLDYETFELSDNYDCSMERALAILNQEGDFNTTFQGFVDQQGALYIIVGGKGPDAFTSSLVVQNLDETIAELRGDELGMIGTQLVVDFETRENQGEGFEYQILNSVSIR